MLKAYAVALVLSTSAPLADKAPEGAKPLDQTKAPTTEIKRKSRSWKVRF